MDALLNALTDWLKEMLVGGIMSNLTGMFDSVNQQVGDIATQVGQTPQGWNGSIFSMIQNLSNSIMVPIAGVILAIVMTMELIQMITDKNNLHDVDTWMIFKWVFKSAVAIIIVSNTWNIVMGVFDMAQNVVAQAAGIIGSDASIDISSVMTDMESRLMDMELGPLFGLWFQSLFIGITMWALYICIFIVIYGRMIEIYLVTSVAPIPIYAKQQRHPLRLKIEEASYPEIMANEEALTQIGSIFITNAIAHTKEDTTIEICCNLLKNNVVEIGVHDYGQGIAEKDLPRIFERFYRADPSRTTNGHYGLGLSVAKSLAEQQSLHIGARNTPGGGAMFYICTQ